MRIKSIINGSIASRKGIQPGDELIEINSHPINDPIDYKYYSTEDNLQIRVRTGKREAKPIRIRKLPDQDLGIEFYDAKYNGCKNNCIFCFVHQLPKGLRRALYFKDEDFRLSFLHGNFITLTNTSSKDIERIIYQKLSPLYISVHTTDETLRRSMLGNPNIPDIMPKLKRLASGKIEMHTQIVLCPGVNDGEYLDKTVQDLSSLYPYVKSLAVVPVGLTKFRNRLPKIKPVNNVYSREIIQLVNNWQREFRRKLGVGFVYAADEFYTKAGLDIPGKTYYDEYPQIENGVGMMRQFIDTFKSKRRLLPSRLDRKLKIVLLTGVSASGMIKDIIDHSLASISGLSVRPVVVKNNFLGHYVTVTGLLSGKDILKELRKGKNRKVIIILPPNCVNEDGLFLDDLTPQCIEMELGGKVVLGSYDLVQSMLQILEMHS